MQFKTYLRLWVIGIVASVGFLGCASMAATPATQVAGAAASDISTVPSPSTFDFVHRSTKVLLLSPAALVQANPYLEADLIEEQCRFHTPDPPVMVPDSTLSNWVFKGRLDSTRYAQALEYRSIFLPWAHGDKQLNTWPMKLETLSALPQEFLDERLTTLASAKAPTQDESIGELTQTYIRQAEKVEEVTQRLERTYDPQRECMR